MNAATADPGVVLIVDDDEALQRLYTRVFASEGMATQSALHVRAAISMAESAAVRLVVLDLMMPGDPGLDFLDWLRSRDEYADLPVIILTGCVDLSDRTSEYVTLHNAQLLRKPIAPSELLQQVRESLGTAASAARPQ
jgi:two-component system phosphate regulon response regulator OmpR